MVEALRDGTIDVIASDHCPQDQDSKRLPFAQAACGVIGVQTMLPVCLRLVHEGELGLLALLRTHDRGAGAHPGPGRRPAGARAPRPTSSCSTPRRPGRSPRPACKSLSKNTAFEGRLVEGRVARTLVDGRTIYQHGG